MAFCRGTRFETSQRMNASIFRKKDKKKNNYGATTVTNLNAVDNDLRSNYDEPFSVGYAFSTVNDEFSSRTELPRTRCR